MNILTNWKFWTITYLIAAVLYAQTFKRANRNMKNATLLTILLEFFTACFSILLIPLFEFKISTNIITYIILLAVSIIYAITDRLNIESRYGLEPSIFSMLKQLSTAFIIILGILFLKEPLIFNKLLGAFMIIFSNFLLSYNKRKIKFNKYFIMCFFSNFLFAIAMIINVNIAQEFNIAFYCLLTVLVPALMIKLITRYKIKDLKEEFNLYDKKLFIFSAAMWSIMLISSIKAYEFGNIVVVASLLALTSILNSIVEFVFNKNKKELLKKVILSILIITGVILINI